MTFESLRGYCLSKENTTEEYPFNPTVAAFKVHGKIFVLTDSVVFESINLKCDPERSIELREQYDSITPGYHMNKKHWITVKLDGIIPDKFLLEWIDESYRLVANV